MKPSYDIDEVVTAINIPLSRWPGNCTGIASAMMEAGLVDNGYLQRGHWVGPVAKGSHFYGKPIIPHTWIEMNDYIIDPTRWVFEAAQPYIWVGEDMACYDPGGNLLREMIMNPCPPFNPNLKHVELPLDKVCASYVLNWLQDAGMPTEAGVITSVNHCFWLANLPLQHLGPIAKPLYEALIAANFKASIPIDNYRMVMK